MRKSIFLAKMSHELRTPLNAVIGYSELLSTISKIARAGHKVKDLERIRSAGRHLLALVNDVIDLSSIEADRAEIDVRTTDIRNLIDEVVATAAPLVSEARRTSSWSSNDARDIGTARARPAEIEASRCSTCSATPPNSPPRARSLSAWPRSRPAPAATICRWKSPTTASASAKTASSASSRLRAGRERHVEQVRRHRAGPGADPSLLPDDGRDDRRPLRTRHRYDLHYRDPDPSRPRSAPPAMAATS